MIRWTQRLELFKIAFVQKLRLWILLIPISLLISCAAKQNITDWQRFDTGQSFKTHQSCTARGLIRLQTNTESMKADFKLRFTDHSKSPELLLLLLNPFGQNSGKLAIRENQGTWSDEAGIRPLTQDPLMKKWYTKSWAEEVRFILGIQSKSPKSLIEWSPSTNQIRLSSPGDRSWECQFKSSIPAECRLMATEISGEVNFTSVECR